MLIGKKHADVYFSQFWKDFPTQSPTQFPENIYGLGSEMKSFLAFN